MNLNILHYNEELITRNAYILKAKKPSEWMTDLRLALKHLQTVRFWKLTLERTLRRFESFSKRTLKFINGCGMILEQILHNFESNG